MEEVGVSWRLEGLSEMGDLELVDCEESLKVEELEKKEEGDGGVVRWEEYLPRMVIRVLLVEADDSTRQIIAALLRKCNYKVAAIPDGLKAWEILKRKHNNIDLILTEVDLPSISGYALLTLIMEHDSCKNIPVIMMSSSDSISTVFKCMLKGAADFLIKPVRRNELKNLWQHVWRRISANDGSGARSLQNDHGKAEVTSKNKATRNCSDDDVSSSRKRSRSMEKASDAQSSCPTRYLEAEYAHVENVQDLSRTKHHGTSYLGNEVQQHEKGMRLEKQPEEEKSTRLESSGIAQGNEGCASVSRLERVGSSAGKTAPKERIEPASCRKMDALPSGEISKTATQAIDLIGTIDNHLERRLQQSTSNHQMRNSGASPQLELSLRRSNDPNDQKNDEKQKLNHSNSSAFSRYSSNKKLQTLLPLSSNCPSEVVNGGDKSNENLVALSSDEENKSTVMPGPTPIPEPKFPVPRVAFTGMCPSYGPMYPSQAPTGPKPTIQNEPLPFFPSTSLQSDPGAHCSSLAHSGFDETSNHEEKLASEDQQKRVNGAASQSANSTLCSNGLNVEDDHVRADNSSNVIVSEQLGRTKGVHNSQREAALAKFRQKRKDRCYEKKVRYQSRKRLAEQRPRVKGQFVRQAQADQPVADTDSRHEDDGG